MAGKGLEKDTTLTLKLSKPLRRDHRVFDHDLQGNIFRKRRCSA